VGLGGGKEMSHDSHDSVKAPLIRQRAGTMQAQARLLCTVATPAPLQSENIGTSAAQNGYACQERRQHRGHGRHAGEVCKGGALCAGACRHLPLLRRWSPALPFGGCRPEAHPTPAWQGKILGNEFIVIDCFALPVEGTETRVNAAAEGYEYMVDFAETMKVGRLLRACASCFFMCGHAADF
jgi:hypothetical protein